jgi:hypothetical protein
MVLKKQSGALSMKIAILLIGAAALAVAAPAAAASKAAAAKACFRTAEIGNHTVGDDHTLYLNVGAKDVYRVTMRNTCMGGVSSTDPIELSARAGSQSICEASDLDIRTTLAGGGGLPSRCLIDEVTKLSPAEAATKRKAK